METHGLLIKAISIHASHANNNHSTQAHLTLASKYSKRAGREVGSQSTSTCRYHVLKGAVSWPIRDLPEGGRGQSSNLGALATCWNHLEEKQQQQQQNIKRNAGDWVSPSGDCHLIINNNCELIIIL